MKNDKAIISREKLIYELAVLKFDINTGGALIAIEDPELKRIAEAADLIIDFLKQEITKIEVMNEDAK